jgi:endoglucanase
MLQAIKPILFSCLLFFAFNLAAQSSQDLIRINQSGYYPAAPKIAVLVSNFEGDEYTSKNFPFYLLKHNAGDTVFENSLSAIQQSANSSLKTRIADFSSFQQPGEYVLHVPGIGTSYPFEISNDVHKEAAISSLKGFYYIRVSTPLEEKYAGKWHRPAGHPDTAVLVHPSAASARRPVGTKLSSPGGWYDAGDYNKYIVNSGITTGTMLSAYEDFSSYFDGLNTNIPESSNDVPDVLDETLCNLRWMLTMQDPNDGGVYHKCTNASFDGMVMPGVTKLPRYVVQKGTGAALNFAAVMAQASRVYKKYYPSLSDSCLKAAVAAWQWAQKNPALIYDQNEINKAFEPKITTGAYGDRNFKDEWFWAASELLATTGKKIYYDSAFKNQGDLASLPSWNNVRMLGYYTLLRSKNSLPSFAVKILPALEKRLIDFVTAYLSKADSNAFRTVMGSSKRDFIWGSSSVAANQGIAFINAYLLTKDKKYIDYALTNLDYLLGRNGTGYSFLTGIGSKQVMRPHHRPSIADGIEEPIPGLLSGGPNPGRQDKCHYDHTEPETAFSDTDCSYASNEIAINWNAPMVYLANAIEALQKNAGYAQP